MISGKDVRIENGYIIINGNKYPIVQDVSEIETYVDNLIKTEYVSIVIASLRANSDTIVSIPLTVPAGYAALGCLQTLTSTRSIAITGAWINAADNTLKMNCVNLSSTDLSNVTVASTVEYIRSNS